jgi:hypothetical protein
MSIEKCKIVNNISRCPVCDFLTEGQGIFKRQTQSSSCGQGLIMLLGYSEMSKLGVGYVVNRGEKIT